LLAGAPGELDVSGCNGTVEYFLAQGLQESSFLEEQDQGISSSTNESSIHTLAPTRKEGKNVKFSRWE
jgi:hypothetical protein